MFFYLSKVAWFFLQPSNAFVLSAGLGAVLLAAGRLRRTGRALLAIGLAGLLLFGFSPLGNLLILPLEERFPAWREAEAPPDGIIVLGGSFVSGISEARGTVELNEAAERLTEFAALARRYPDARLVFSGGYGALFPAGKSEAELASELLEALGVDPARLVLEDRSRNTWENAVFSHELLQPQSGERWLLVTSAWHMPRAVGSFRAAGFAAEAYPVDFRTRGWNDVFRPFDSAAEGLRRTDFATREWIGLLVYRVTGRSSRLLPSP